MLDISRLQTEQMTISCASLDVAALVERVVEDVRRDLSDGTWERRHGHLRQLQAFDVGLRLIVAT
jgi:hypothetical protein